MTLIDLQQKDDMMRNNFLINTLLCLNKDENMLNMNQIERYCEFNDSHPEYTKFLLEFVHS